MGTIKKGILGGFSGTVGTVVGGSWKGIAYMRGKAQSIRNPRTAAQMEQRLKMKLLVKALKGCASLVNIGFKAMADSRRMSPMNAALSYNSKLNPFTGTYPNIAVDYTKLVLSLGRLTPTTSLSLIDDGGDIEFVWAKNGGEGNARDDDFGLLLLVNTETGEAKQDFYLISRDDGTTITPPSSWSGQSVIGFVSFTKCDDRTFVSDSVASQIITLG